MADHVKQATTYLQEAIAHSKVKTKDGQNGVFIFGRTTCPDYRGVKQHLDDQQVAYNKIEWDTGSVPAGAENISPDDWKAGVAAITHNTSGTFRSIANNKL